MSTGLLERTDEKVAVTNDGDHDKFQHYFFKKDIAENLLAGKPMKAVCGKIVTQQADPKDRKICDECAEFHKHTKDE